MEKIRVAHFPGRLDPAPSSCSYYYWILIRLFHRADNMQRVLFIVGSCHLHCSSFKLNPYVNSIGTRLGLGRLAHLLVLLFFRLRARLEHHWF
jgi:hypothetical protein